MYLNPNNFKQKSYLVTKNKTNNYLLLQEKFIQQLINIQKQNKVSITSIFYSYLQMNYQSKIEQIDKLKTWLDSFRPYIACNS